MVGCVSVNKDSMNQSHCVRGGYGLLIHSGTVSSQDEIEAEATAKPHRHKKPPKSSSRKAPLPSLSLSLSVCVTASLPLLRCLRLSLHRRVAHVYLCSLTFDTRPHAESVRRPVLRLVYSRVVLHRSEESVL